MAVLCTVNEGDGITESIVDCTPAVGEGNGVFAVVEEVRSSRNSFPAVPGVSNMYSKTRSRCGKRLCFIHRESINLSSGAQGSLEVSGCSEPD